MEADGGFYGVSFHKRKNKYQCCVKSLKPAEQEALPERYCSLKNLCGGLYATAEEAAVATDK